MIPPECTPRGLNPTKAHQRTNTRFLSSLKKDNLGRPHVDNNMCEHGEQKTT